MIAVQPNTAFVFSMPAAACKTAAASTASLSKLFLGPTGVPEAMATSLSDIPHAHKSAQVHSKTAQAFASDGQGTVWCGGSNTFKDSLPVSEVVPWDVNAGLPASNLPVISGNLEPILTICLVGNQVLGRGIVTVTQNFIKLFDVQSGVCIHSRVHKKGGFAAHPLPQTTTAPIPSVLFGALGSYLIFQQGGNIAVWSWLRAFKQISHTSALWSVACCAIVPPDTLIVSCGTASIFNYSTDYDSYAHLEVLRIPALCIISPYTTIGHRVVHMHTSSNGKYVALGMVEGSIAVYTVPVLSRVWEKIGAHRSCRSPPNAADALVTCIFCDNDGGCFSSDWDGNVKAWDKNGTALWHIPCSTKVIHLSLHKRDYEEEKPDKSRKKSTTLVTSTSSCTPSETHVTSGSSGSTTSPLETSSIPPTISQYVALMSKSKHGDFL